MKLRLICTSLLCVLATVITTAQQKVTNTADLQPMDDAIYHGYLPNGLAYYVRKNVSPKKRAVLYLVEKAGSLQEDDDQLGLAHFTEHMAFNGTRNFPKKELIDYLQKSGVKFGADVNAHTSYGQTVYELGLPTDSMQVFNKGLDILSDWAGYVTFDEDEVNQERHVILEEARLREKTANGRMNNQTMALDYNNSRFSVRSPIGTEESIKNAKPALLKKFYHDWYRPDAQAVIIVGDFNPRQVVQLIKEKFSALQNPEHERAFDDYSISPIMGTRVKILTDKETPYTFFSMTVRLPGTLTRTNEEYLQRIKAYLFNYMMNNRINELVKKGNPPFLNASAFNSTSLGHTDVFNTRILPKPGELENSVKAVCAEIERAKKFGFTDEEFSAAKDWALRARSSAFNDRENHPSASYAAEYERNFLEDEGIPGLEYEYNFNNNHLGHIRLSEINALLTPYTSDQNRLILLEAPEKEAATLPDEKMLLSWIGDAGNDVSAYHAVEVDKNADFLPYDLKSGKIASDTSDHVIGTQTFILSNGARVILKNTNFRNGQILFDIYGFGGTSLATDADYPSARMAGGLVGKSGIEGYTQVELDKILSNKGVGISPYIHEYMQGITGGATQHDFEIALKLIHLYFTAPRKDSAVWAGQISVQKALLATNDNSPGRIFGDTVNAVMHNYNFRANDATEAMLNSANIMKAYNFYKDRFADASNFTFVFVGNLDDIGIRSLLKKYIGSLPATNSKQTFKNLGDHPPTGKITKIIHKGIDNKSTVEMIFNGAYDYNQENNMQLNALGEILQIKLTERLRQQEGETYSARAGAYYLNYPEGRYNVGIQFDCDSANVNKLITATMDEVNKLKQNGASAVDIQKFTNEEARSTQLKVKQNNFWLQHISSTAKNNEDPDYIIDYIKSLSNITPESTKATANKYLNGENLLKFILMPEGK